MRIALGPWWLPLVFLACGEPAVPAGPVPLAALDTWRPTALTLTVSAIEPITVETPLGALHTRIGTGVMGDPAVSPSGRWVSFRDWTQELVALRDLEQGTSRALTLAEGESFVGVAFLDDERVVVAVSGADGAATLAMLDLPTLSVVGAHRWTGEGPRQCVTLAASTTHGFCVLDARTEWAAGPAIPHSGQVVMLDRAGALRVVAHEDLVRTPSAAHGEQIAYAPFAEEGAGVVVLLTADGTRRTIASSESYPTSLAFSPDGSLLAVGTQAGTLTAYATATGAPVRGLPSASGELSTVHVLDDGTLMRWAEDLEVSPPTGASRWLASPCMGGSAIAVAGERVVIASINSVCTHGLGSGALDGARSMATPDGQLVVRGSEVLLLVTTYDHASRPAPYVLRFDLVSGRLLSMEEGAGAAVRAASVASADDVAWRARLPVAMFPGCVAAHSTIGSGPDDRLLLLDGAGQTLVSLDPHLAVAVGRSGAMATHGRGPDGAPSLRMHATLEAPGMVLPVEGLPAYAELQLTDDGRHVVVFDDRELVVASTRDGTARARRPGALAVALRGDLAVVATTCTEGEPCLTRLQTLRLPDLSPVSPDVLLDDAATAVAIGDGFTLVHGHRGLRVMPSPALVVAASLGAEEDAIVPFRFSDGPDWPMGLGITGPIPTESVGSLGERGREPESPGRAIGFGSGAAP